MVGGGAALLELEARQVSRSVRGDLNRVINAESANLQRAVAAAARQLEAIDAVEADGRLARQSNLVRLVADTRREVPEATFTRAGGAVADPPLGRSTRPGPDRIPGAPRRRGSGEAFAVAGRGRLTHRQGPSVAGRGADCPSGRSPRSVIIGA